MICFAVSLSLQTQRLAVSLMWTLLYAVSLDTLSMSSGEDVLLKASETMHGARIPDR